MGPGLATSTYVLDRARARTARAPRPRIEPDMLSEPRPYHHWSPRCEGSIVEPSIRASSGLAEYVHRSADEAKIMRFLPEEFARHIDDFLISVGPATGRMLHLLAIGANAETILELRSAYGYSTIWFTNAARETGGKVVGLELSQAKSTMRRRSSRAPGLRSGRTIASTACSHAAAPGETPSTRSCWTYRKTCSSPASSSSIRS